MIKKPIYTEFNLDSMTGNSRAIAVSHIDDTNTEVLEVCVRQGGEKIDLTGATVKARMVWHKEKALVSDNVACTVDSGNVLIPFDNAAIQTHEGILKIEVNITRQRDVLTLQFPIYVKVNDTILADAKVTPESQGTIPELLKEVREELARVQGYVDEGRVFEIIDLILQGDPNIIPSLFVEKNEQDDYQLVYVDSEKEETHVIFNFGKLGSGTKDYSKLENKPSINSHTLSGNQSSDDLGLQKKLTAGQNITIGNDGTISASGGVTSYNDLTDKPRVADAGFDYFDIDKTLYFPDFDISLQGLLKKFSLKPLTTGKLENGDGYYVREAYRSTFNLNTPVLDMYGKWFYFDATNATGLPSGIDVVTTRYENQNKKIMMYSCRACQIYDVVANIDLPLLQEIYWTDSTLKNHYAIRTYIKKTDGTRLFTDWLELSGSGSQIVSGAVDANGHITFTDSDGNTFTTTGESVIGPQGAPGQNYVLTAQDKTDIANIVLSELPTTQGVLYGNTSN